MEISPRMSGRENMDADLALLDACEKGSIPPAIRFYSWHPPCVSFGYSQTPEDLIDASALRDLGWDIIKRPTGGGAAFHNTDEIAYSIVGRSDDGSLSQGLNASYKAISNVIIAGLNKLGVDAELSKVKKAVHSEVCFSYPTSHEIVVGGRKIAGSAQKRGRRAFLQHGSIFVSRIDDRVLNTVKGIDVKAVQDSYVSIEDILGRKPSFDEIVSALKPSFCSIIPPR